MAKPTLSELATFCQNHGWFNNTTAGVVQLKAWINDVLQFLAIERRWPYYETAAFLNLTAPYSTGTVDLTNLGTTVTGSGTANFDSGMAGQEFYTAEDAGRVYQIDTVNATAETMVLASAYLGSTGTGKTYEIRYVRYAAPTNWGQEGVARFEDGSDLNVDTISLIDWHTMRMKDRSRDARPRHLLHTVVSGTHYFYVHPAPSSVGQIRYTYYRLPAVLGDSDEADMPDAFRLLLKESLATRMATDNADAALEGLRESRYQRMIDKVFEASYPRKPVSIQIGRASETRIGIHDLASLLDFTDPTV